MRSRAEWWEKANAYASAWADAFGAQPSTANVALGLSVAEHETRCGDAWPGHNWGACTKGTLSATQRAALAAAGVHAAILRSPALEALEASATAALEAAGCPVPDDAELHVDSSPAAGAYFTLFGKFADDGKGARYFVHVLAEQRSICRQILQQAERLTDGGCVEIAGAMYRSAYFTGFHDPHQPGGVDANIGDYARALVGQRPTIAAALVGWTPGAEVPAVTEPATPDITTVEGLQAALNQLDAAMALTEDGIMGPKTTAALRAFQASQGLTPDGVAGPGTLAALRAAMGAS